ncbi:endoglucanase 24 [Cajanus cajan]|nr:endoglucanase 24 [Cajanus cajan]
MSDATQPAPGVDKAGALETSRLAWKSPTPELILSSKSWLNSRLASPYRCPTSSEKRTLDELLWGAAWLRRATQDDNFLNYIQANGKTLGADDNINEFGWDNKHAGLNVLVSKEVIEGNMYSLESYKSSAESFLCTLIPESPTSHIQYTPGGLVYRPGGSNLQHATSIAFLELVYANYLTHTSQAINCGNVYVSAQTLRQHAKRQVDYILGDNPMGLSYMVGYSNYYPQRIHHRGSSLPSIKDHPQFIACKEGSIYYNSTNPNPNVLVGAIVGGPDENDDYEDDRIDFRKSEPTTYINAPFVGVLAYFAANPNVS